MFTICLSRPAFHGVRGNTGILISLSFDMNKFDICDFQMERRPIVLSERHFSQKAMRQEMVTLALTLLFQV